MRSRLICSLVSIATFAIAGTARAEVRRLRVLVDDLPLQDEAFEVSAKNAMLPNGVKDHGPVPKTWRKAPENGDSIENARCTDDRRASIGTLYGTTGTMWKIWEADGKTWLDHVDVDTAFGYVEVKHADRTALKPIADGIWGFRRKSTVAVVTAKDIGFVDEGGFYECSISQNEIATVAGSVVIDSSPSAVNTAIKDIAQLRTEPGKKPKWTPEWVGVEYKILASVSKSSADAAPMLNIVIKTP